MGIRASNPHYHMTRSGLGHFKNSSRSSPGKCGGVVSVMALGDSGRRTPLGQCEQGRSWVDLPWNPSRVTSREKCHFSDLHVYKHQMELILPRLSLKTSTDKAIRMMGGGVGGGCTLLDYIHSFSAMAQRQAGTPLGGEFVLLRQNKRILRGQTRKR